MAIRLLFALFAAVLISLTGAAAASALGTLPRHDRALSGTPFPLNALSTTTSAKDTFAAGYAIKAAFSKVTDVQANWHVPAIAKACPASLTTYSFAWVGIDGVTSPTFEAIGTATNCVAGSVVHYAWYELYPTISKTIKMNISAGDTMHGEVKVPIPGAFTLTLKDLTKGKSFSVTKGFTAQRTSAEWFASTAVSGPLTLPMTDFGKVTFRNASATISGHTHSISGFSNIAYTMWNFAGTAVKASVGALSNGGAQFIVTWKARGP
jgi:Peptidase A4 family